jgi:hypothetical protein
MVKIPHKNSSRPIEEGWIDKKEKPTNGSIIG